MTRSFVSLVVAGSWLVACGSSTPGNSAGDGGPSGIPDSSISTDAPPAIEDAGPADSAPALDSGQTCYAAGSTTDSCRTCCENSFGAGYQVFANFTVICACQGSLCGPPEGGAPEAGSDDAGATDAGVADAGLTDAAIDAAAADAGAEEGGLFGQDVCAATCAGKAAPSSSCNTCILDTLGSVSSFGPCGLTVYDQCIGDTNCVQYFGCVSKCP